MADLNLVILVGRLTRDPVLRYTPGGQAVADLGLATSRTYVGKDGQKKEDTCFVDIIVWGKQAEASNEYLKKGSSVLIEGRLQLDSWETKEGEKRSKLRVNANRVQFLERANSNSAKNNNDQYDVKGENEFVPSSVDQEDDIPF